MQTLQRISVIGWHGPQLSFWDFPIEALRVFSEHFMTNDDLFTVSLDPAKLLGFSQIARVSAPEVATDRSLSRMLSKRGLEGPTNPVTK